MPTALPTTENQKLKRLGTSQQTLNDLQASQLFAFCIESYATLRGVCSPKKSLGPVSF